MKKLLVKAQHTVTPFSPAIPTQPEKWVKDELEVFELPENAEEYVYHPAIEGVDEVAEVKEWKVIAQTQGPENELLVWLETDKHKYPEGYVVEWIDITEEWNKKLAIQAKIDLGKKAKDACDNVLALISGYNLDRGLDVEQISAMQTAFTPIEKALQAGRPSLAKHLISQVVADGVLVSQEMKDSALLLLEEY